MLIIQSLSKEPVIIENLSHARDTKILHKVLKGKGYDWDVKDAGTAMRFGSAYLALQGKGQILRGTARMHQRPIGPLTDALKALGARVEFLGKQGYPPLEIHKLESQKSDRVEMAGDISSQYISALLMIAPRLPKGLTLAIRGKIASRPYIDMTLSLMGKFGIHHSWQDQEISIAPQNYSGGTIHVESDWSAASYYYSMISLRPNSSLKLLGLYEESLQGDARIASIMRHFNVVTKFEEDGVLIQHDPVAQPIEELDFSSSPDLAQTLMVVAALRKVPLKMTGLESLKIKETDRIKSMDQELGKIGATIQGENPWIITPKEGIIEPVPTILTYQDHRMAMAFSPRSMLEPTIIDNPGVVEKSNPDFWNHLKALGVEIGTPQRKDPK